MEFKELQLEEIQHEHPIILEDLQHMHQGYKEYDDEIDDNDLITMQEFKCICDRCGLGIDWYHRNYYKCSSMSCNYSIHKFCAEICTTLRSPAHPSHILILKKGTTNWKCSSCLTDHDQDGIYYHCSTCNYKIDLRCATFLDQKTVHHPGHSHPLISVTVEPILSKCFACGKKHEGKFYHCTTCLNFSINSECLTLPIKCLTKHHSHMLTLCYSFSDQQYGSECRICEKELYSDIWIYKCSKCMFYAHLNCQPPLGRDLSKLMLLYDSHYKNRGVPRFPVHDESYNPLPQSRGVNEEIRDENGYLIHFSHEHPLVLIHNKSNNDKASTSEVKSMSLHNPMKRIKLLCNGCVRPIMTMPFYKCSHGYNECSNFALHESCARLHTRIKCYECPHTLVLQQSGPLFWCRICKLPCNGFAYNCDTCGYNIDVHCGSRPSEIKHEAHACDMYLWTPQSNRPWYVRTPRSIRKYLRKKKLMNTRRACYACRNIIDELGTYYECPLCDYYLDCLCALHLPKKIRNKYDKHPLTLRYSPIENHKGQYFCEVCEDDLNPEKWFYHCSECSQSIHSACATLILQSEQGVDAVHEDCVYKFVNMKFGGVINTEDHVHPLSFVAGTISDGDCTKCGLDLQSKFILKCLQCKFAIHSYCESSITESAKQELVEMFKNLEKIREPKIHSRPQRVVTFYPEEIIRPETQPSKRV
ncbi:DC1, Protein kinase C, alpha/beta/gamma type [Artemisia annua]|uniref:DC1, Protein kinase C, alpha/beta/gamma type n=1 Tax=Artemisia annua TaxID=35608 RepID=A0A2U1LRE9_ARTAN|nr:DC1, Protein kinase C, alpha/beta/gamma type [Artemisia annua]